MLLDSLLSHEYNEKLMYHKVSIVFLNTDYLVFFEDKVMICVEAGIGMGLLKGHQISQDSEEHVNPSPHLD